MVRTQVLKHLRRAKKGQRKESKKDVRRGATASGAMEKDGCVIVIEGKEMTQSNTSSAQALGVPFESQRG